MAQYFLACNEEMMGESPTPADDLLLAAQVREQRSLSLSGQLEIAMTKPLRAFSDPKILKDPRALESMLKLEAISYPQGQQSGPNYFETLQTDLQPSMRQTVGMWMYEVCEEEKLEPVVFLRAMKQLDNFLEKQKIRYCQLQLAATVCLLISSKLAGTMIPTRTLVAYTSYGVNRDEVLAWEGLVLTILKWDPYDTVAVDFLPYILHRLPKTIAEKKSILERIHLLIAFSATDLNLMVYPPSFIASAAVGAALGPNYIGQKAYEEVLTTIQAVTNIELGRFLEGIEKVKCSMQGFCNTAKSNPEWKGSSTDRNGNGL